MEVPLVVRVVDEPLAEVLLSLGSAPPVQSDIPLHPFLTSIVNFYRFRNFYRRPPLSVQAAQPLTTTHVRIAHQPSEQNQIAFPGP
jgi:hypothetical protein